MIFIISCNPESNNFHSPESEQPSLDRVLSIPKDEVSYVPFQRLLCPPAINYYLLSCHNQNDNTDLATFSKLLIRGDSFGKIAIWSILDVSNSQEAKETPSIMEPTAVYSLSKAWEIMSPSPCGILDQLVCQNLLYTFSVN